MKAWTIEDRALVLRDHNPEALGPESVRVRVRAIGVNRADLLQVLGRYPAPAGFSQAIPGLEFVGEVLECGERALAWRTGERVMGLIPGGAYAEQVVVHERELLRVPDCNGKPLSDAEAATLPEAFLTAYRALFVEAGVQPGDWCLVRPASAGVGLAAVQLCHALGARPIGSSRDPARLDNARAFGLQAAVEEGPELAAAITAATDGAGVRAVLDMVGPDWSALLPALQPEGCIALIGLLGGGRTELDLGMLLMRRQRLLGLTMRSQPLEQRIRVAQWFNQRLAPLFTAGRLQPLPLQGFAFAAVAEAHAHMRDDPFSGKRVLLLD